MSETKDGRQIELSPDALTAAEQIRKLSGVATIEDAVRVALGDELYFRRKLYDGFRVLVSRGDDTWEVDLTPPE